MPEPIERQECPECGAAIQISRAAETCICRRCGAWFHPEQAVTVRYVRERQPVPVTEELTRDELREVVWAVARCLDPNSVLWKGHENAPARMVLESASRKLDAALNGGKDGV